MERIGTLESVWRYPVKSMAGEEVEAAFVGFAGLMGDRAYAFVRDPGPKGFPWHTGREQEDLVLFRPHFRDPGAASLPEHLEASLDMGPGVLPVFPDAAAFALEVTTPEGAAWPIRSPELKAEIERRSGQAVALRFSERSLYDCRPVSLLGNASVAALGHELGRPLDRRRFRANLHADWLADRPWHENELVGRSIVIGPRVRLALLERDPRCKMITIDPNTAQVEPGILRHVRTAHGGMVGIYAAVLAEGVVRRGDAIALA